MRTKIAGEYPEAEFLRYSVPVIYVADFSERTKAVRKVEVHETIPECPDKAGHSMDCFQLSNPQSLPIDFHIFSDHQFVDDEGKDIEHCECCFFPVSSAEGRIWIGFLEIKDCKVKNIVRYKEKTDYFYRTFLSRERYSPFLSDLWHHIFSQEKESSL